jgi:hypothetical protein
MALSSLYILTNHMNDNYVAGGYALSIGMLTGIVVLILLGRATPYRPIRKRKAAAPTGTAPLATGTGPLSADPAKKA